MARVRCEHCGRELEVFGAEAIANGWPTCCHGHTMRLQTITDAEIEQGVADAAGAPLPYPTGML